MTIYAVLNAWVIIRQAISAASTFHPLLLLHFNDCSSSCISVRHTLLQRQVFCDVQQPLHCKDCTYISDERSPQHNMQKSLYSCCCICAHPSLLHSGMMAIHLVNCLLFHTFHFAVINGCELIVCYVLL